MNEAIKKEAEKACQLEYPSVDGNETKQMSLDDIAVIERMAYRKGIDKCFALLSGVSIDFGDWLHKYCNIGKKAGEWIYFDYTEKRVITTKQAFDIYKKEVGYE